MLARALSGEAAAAAARSLGARAALCGAPGEAPAAAAALAQALCGGAPGGGVPGGGAGGALRVGPRKAILAALARLFSQPHARAALLAAGDAMAPIAAPALKRDVLAAPAPAPSLLLHRDVLAALLPHTWRLAARAPSALERASAAAQLAAVAAAAAAAPEGDLSAERTASALGGLAPPQRGPPGACPARAAARLLLAPLLRARAAPVRAPALSRILRGAPHWEARDDAGEGGGGVCAALAALAAGAPSPGERATAASALVRGLLCGGGAPAEGALAAVAELAGRAAASSLVGVRVPAGSEQSEAEAATLSVQNEAEVLTAQSDSSMLSAHAAHARATSGLRQLVAELCGGAPAHLSARRCVAQALATRGRRWAAPLLIRLALSLGGGPRGAVEELRGLPRWVWLGEGAGEGEGGEGVGASQACPHEAALREALVDAAWWGSAQQCAVFERAVLAAAGAGVCDGSQETPGDSDRAATRPLPAAACNTLRRAALAALCAAAAAPVPQGDPATGGWTPARRQALMGYAQDDCGEVAVAAELALVNWVPSEIEYAGGAYLVVREG